MIYPDLTPDLAAAEALRTLHRALLGEISIHRRGAAAGQDPEELHDLRVALRRTRTLLSRIKKVYPEGVRRDFTRGFARLSRATGSVRDLDVLLESLDGYAAFAEQDGDGVEAVRTRLEGLRQGEQLALRAALRDPACEGLLKRWRAFLAQPTGAKPRRGRRPVLEAALRSLRETETRLRAGCRELGEASPEEELHRLRILGKHLRYLLEAFQSLFPPGTAWASIQNLKRAQDLLGEHQDLTVHPAVLRAACPASDRGMDRRPAAAAARIVAALLHRREEVKDEVRSELRGLLAGQELTTLRELWKNR